MWKLLCGLLAVFIGSVANAADEKIDPKTYICAELVASSVDGQPPLFEALQLDGFSAGLANRRCADATIMEPLLISVSDSCAAAPGDTALSHWQAATKNLVAPDDGSWCAHKTTCADYQANPDDGSGFVIWLDGYQRAKNNKAASIFSSQKTLDDFLAACKAAPQRLMMDVMTERAK